MNRTVIFDGARQIPASAALDALARDYAASKAALEQQAMQDAQAAHQREQSARIEADRLAAEQAERDRKQELIAQVMAEPKVMGSIGREWAGHGHGSALLGDFDLKRFGIVVVADGKLALPVVHSDGRIGNVEQSGPMLEIHQSKSELMPVNGHQLALSFARLAVMNNFREAVDVELERLDVPADRLALYLAAMPSVEFTKDPELTGLGRIHSTWGDVFAYSLPSFTNNHHKA